MKTLLITLTIALASLSALAQGVKVGDKVPDFNLKNVDGKMVALSDYKDAKGAVVIFTCNHCPYAQAYEQRIIDLHKTYAAKGYPVIAINPNDPSVQPQDSYELMQQRAKDKGYPFVYLFDEGQLVYPKYGATKTPHVYLLQKRGADFMVEYIGTIDDNYKDESAVKEKYLANAIDALIAGKKLALTETKAIGCTIKVKK